MKLLAVIDKNRALGYNNDLLFRLPTDLAHFKKHTLGQTVVMGQRTLESMPKGKALPGRNTLVLNIDAPTGKLYDVAPGKDRQGGRYICMSFQSLDDFFAYTKEHKEELGELVVSGGAAIYNLLLPFCDELVLTEVDAQAEKVDVYFPEFKDQFRLNKSEGPYFDGELSYYINSYVKK